VITGTGGGHWRATVRLGVAEDAQVVFTDIPQDKGKALAKDLGENATTA
jgi:NAD(P)-dependent dehydrogenase (short-subunit alcohol dehydrogenase family)